jgi:hypothetical protein
MAAAKAGGRKISSFRLIDFVAVFLFLAKFFTRT